MPHHVVSRVADGLNDRRKSINGSRILVLGVAYKADTNDLRESPALEVIRLLQEKGGEIYFHDPYITDAEIVGLSYTELNDRILRWADCVVITTNHTCYDYANIVEHAPMVVDSRNATRDVTVGREKIFLPPRQIVNGAVGSAP